MCLNKGTNQSRLPDKIMGKKNMPDIEGLDIDQLNCICLKERREIRKFMDSGIQCMYGKGK
jgi:hypothetical protein